MLYFVLQRTNLVYTSTFEICVKDKIQSHSFDMALVWTGLGDSGFIAFFMSFGKTGLSCIINMM